MNNDDLIYLSSLVFCLLFGCIYRNIDNKELKKWIGTILGLLLILILSGYHVFHIFVVFTMNVIILFYKKEKCHQLSFAFSFTYLLFFRITAYFGIPNPTAHMNIIHMIFTLKMVGLSLDVKNGELDLQRELNFKSHEHKITEFSNNSSLRITVIDILHYCFNYIGIITGPYFRYKTFKDHIDTPFAKFANCNGSALQKLKPFPLFAFLFLTITYYWPLSYCTSEEFYENRSWFYRIWYTWPIFYGFRMRIYCGFILSECICIMAGLGAYPIFTVPKPGQGPTENLDEISKIAKDNSKLEETVYNFETVNNVDPYNVENCMTIRAAVKYWNTCIQYWLVVNVYKCFPYKKFRTFATLFVSAYWHGIHLGYYMCILGVALYLPIEDLYVNLFVTNNFGRKLKLWKCFMWYMKMQTFGYLCIAMQLLHFEKVMRYFNSVYHFWLILLIFLYLLGLVLKSIKENEEG